MKILLNCTNCNKAIKAWPSELHEGKKFCSISCGVSYRNKFTFNPSKYRDISGNKNPMFGKGYKIAGRNNGMYGRRGPLCPHFKGITTRKDGYLRIHIRSGKNRRMLYHRYLMEIYLGRKLTRKEIVHHIDGNRSNNELSNLQIMTQSEHINLHRLQKDL